MRRWFHYTKFNVRERRDDVSKKKRGAGTQPNLKSILLRLLLVLRRSDGIDWVDLVVRTAVVVELYLVVHVAFDERDCVVYSHRFWELAVRFKISSLVGRVFEDDIGLGVLIVAQSHENDVALIYPNLKRKREIEDIRMMIVVGCVNSKLESSSSPSVIFSLLLDLIKSDSLDDKINFN